MILSLQPLVAELRPAFTPPSFDTAWQLLLAWVMCPAHHTLRHVADCASPQTPPDHSGRHGHDGYYNFFERSAWTPAGLACRGAWLVLTRLAATSA
jgi:hypothetical protein